MFSACQPRSPSAGIRWLTSAQSAGVSNGANAGPLGPCRLGVSVLEVAQDPLWLRGNEPPFWSGLVPKGDFAHAEVRDHQLAVLHQAGPGPLRVVLWVAVAKLFRRRRTFELVGSGPGRRSMSGHRVGRTVIVHKDEFAYNAHPSIAVLDNGEWLVAFGTSPRRIPRRHPPEDPLFRTLLTWSSDRGETWEEPYFAPGFDWSGVEPPGVSQLSNGSVVLTQFRFGWYPWA